MRSFIVALLTFVSIIVITALIIFMYLVGPDSYGGRWNYLYTHTRLILYRYSLVHDLAPIEEKILYESTCTRKCHSRDVIERTPRTAREWESIVNRMSKRAGINEPEKKAITRYLEKNFLSTVPTILPQKIMGFMKRHLWKSDFGEGDIYFDFIYLPERYHGFFPYLGVNNPPLNSERTYFVVYVNTHSGVLPPWNLKDSVYMTFEKGEKIEPIKWQVVYEDEQRHHREGILTFPLIDDSKGEMEIILRLSGVKEKRFLWKFPIPSLDGTGKADDKK